MTASLGQKLKEVKWGEFKLGKLFEILSSKKRFDANKVQILPQGKYPYIVRLGSNNGQKGYINEDVKYLNDGNTISFGQDTATVYYQENPYFTGDKIKVFKPRFAGFNKRIAPFFLSAIKRAFCGFSWGGSSFDVSIIAERNLSLPVVDSGDLNLAFMESFMSELEQERILQIKAYMDVSGLNNCELTEAEIVSLDKLKTRNLCFTDVSFKSVFDRIKQGRRLKKEDQRPGTIPFVMSGITNNGVVGYISNPIACFPKNSITIDIFGNTFYRSFEYGAGDDTGVYWDSCDRYSEKCMLFFATAMEKAIKGKYSFGEKLRSSQSYDFQMKVPVIHGKIDLETISTIVSAVKKLVIKDVIKFIDRNDRQFTVVNGDITRIREYDTSYQKRTHSLVAEGEQHDGL